MELNCFETYWTLEVRIRRLWKRRVRVGRLWKREFEGPESRSKFSRRERALKAGASSEGGSKLSKRE